MREQSGFPNRARISRRDPAAGRREDRALLLDVRPAFLFDEDHRRCKGICCGTKAFRGRSVASRFGTEGSRVCKKRRRSLFESVTTAKSPASKPTILTTAYSTGNTDQGYRVSPFPHPNLRLDLRQASPKLAYALGRALR